MIVAIVFFLTFWNGITSLRTSHYTQTLVIEDKCFNSHFKLINDVKSETHCSIFCSRDSVCKRFMYCGTSASSANTCLFYENGNDCVVREETGAGCKCFVQMYSNCESGPCECHRGKYGVQCQETFKDCGDGAALSFTGSELTYIKPTSFPRPFEVECDFGNSLTFIQHRKAFCTDLNFNRSYSEYVKGFGNSRVNYWLGLEKIYSILENDASFNWRLDIGWFYTTADFEKTAYSDFSLGNASTGYAFNSENWLNYFGDGNDALLSPPSIGGRPLSTYDNDHTGNYSCSVNFGGGWWYALDARCTNANLNGPFDTATNGITWLNNSVGKTFREIFMRVAN